MADLRIGRIGLDITLANAQRWTDAASPGRRIVTFTGWLHNATASNVDALRTELLEQMDAVELVAVTWDDDPSHDGFYRLVSVNIDGGDGVTSQTTAYRFSVSAERLGGESSVEIQSLLTSALLVNDHGLDVSEVTFWHGAPPDAQAYDAGAATPILHTRDSEDGDVLVMLDITAAAGSVGPTWSVAPGSYYSGASYVNTEGRLRAGLSIPTNSPADWEIGNGLIRVRPQTFQGSSNGRINVARWDGSAYTTSFDFKIVRGANVIPGWNYMTVVRNDPEAVVVRLTRDADEGTPTAHRHVLDLTLRRGSYAVYCYYSYTGAAQTYTVERDTTDAGTAVTPSGATSAAGIVDAAGTERWVIGTPEDNTADTTNGGLDFTSRTAVPFMLGMAHSSDTHDTASDLIVQYLGWSSEKVQGVLR